MRDSTGRGMGTAFPRLLMLGDKDSGSPQRLLLSGGRLFTEGLIDIELWVSSDGMGRTWVRPRISLAFPQLSGKVAHSFPPGI